MRLLILFLSLLFTSISYAKLGETELDVILGHPEHKIVAKGKIDNRATVLVFHDSNDKTEIGVFFLDGRCGEEIMTSLTSNQLSFEDLVSYMKTYTENWHRIEHPSMLAMASDDKRYFALWGPAPYLENRMAFRIFNREWRNYCRDNNVDPKSVKLNTI